MSQITIQCRLVASEATRHQLWQLMAQQNTPLINELLKQVAEHPDFETWRQKGKLPGGIVSQLCKPLKRILASVVNRVDSIVIPIIFRSATVSVATREQDAPTLSLM
ncbi:MAG: hypothetical protein ACLFTJ_12275, partial [Halothece sp.]